MRYEDKVRDVVVTKGENAPEFVQLSERMCEAMMQTIWTEAKRWRRQYPGVGGDTYLNAAMNGLVLASALYACNIVSPEADPTCTAVQARKKRLVKAFSEAARQIILSEDAAIDARGYA